jgi:16S rRNA processing protein RimM
MLVITDFPERLRGGVKVFVGEDHRPLRIRSRRQHGENLLLAFQGVDTPEDAGLLTNELVFVRADDRPALPEGEYYHHQLLGLRVVGESGVYLGKITEILDNPANDIYVVTPDSGPQILIPAIEAVILAVDLLKGEMTVHLLEGLLPGEE